LEDCWPFRWQERGGPELADAAQNLEQKDEHRKKQPSWKSGHLWMRPEEFVVNEFLSESPIGPPWSAASPLALLAPADMINLIGWSHMDRWKFARLPVGAAGHRTGFGHT
jgi:hypothetical protein